jgi:hypothetical protein
MLFHRRYDGMGIIEPLQGTAFTVFTNEVFVMNWVFVSFKPTTLHNALAPIVAKPRMSYTTGQLKDFDAPVRQSPRFSTLVGQVHTFYFGGFASSNKIILAFSTAPAHMVTMSLSSKVRTSFTDNRLIHSANSLSQKLTTGYKPNTNHAYTTSLKTKYKLAVNDGQNKAFVTPLRSTYKIGFTDSRNLSMTVQSKQAGHITFTNARNRAIQIPIKPKVRTSFVTTHADAFTLSLKQKLALPFIDSHNLSAMTLLRSKGTIVFTSTQNKHYTSGLRSIMSLTYISSDNRAVSSVLKSKYITSLVSGKQRHVTTSIATSYRLSASVIKNLGLFVENLEAVHLATTFSFVGMRHIVTQINDLDSIAKFTIIVKHDSKANISLKSSAAINFINADTLSFSGSFKTTFHLGINVEKAKPLQIKPTVHTELGYRHGEQRKFSNSLYSKAMVAIDVSKDVKSLFIVNNRVKFHTEYSSIKTFIGSLKSTYKLRTLSVTQHNFSVAAIRSKYKVSTVLNRVNDVAILPALKSYLVADLAKHETMQGSLRLKTHLDFNTALAKPDGINLGSKALMRFTSSVNHSFVLSMIAVVPISPEDQLLNDSKVTYPEWATPTISFPNQTRF